MALTLSQKDSLKKAIFFARQDPKALADLLEELFSSEGSQGPAGKSVKAIQLTTTDGAVTGGTCTLSDESSIQITVTQSGT